MPYFNIIIPRKYRIPDGATGVWFYDTFEEYFSGNFNDSTPLNKNVLGFENKLFTGKVNGFTKYNHYYLYNDFESTSTGVCECTAATGIFISGYSQKFITGVTIYNHYYLYDTFESYNIGVISNFTGHFQSGYSIKTINGNLI